MADRPIASERRPVKLRPSESQLSWANPHYSAMSSFHVSPILPKTLPAVQLSPSARALRCSAAASFPHAVLPEPSTLLIQLDSLVENTWETRSRHGPSARSTVTPLCTGTWSQRYARVVTFAYGGQSAAKNDFSKYSPRSAPPQTNA